MSARETPVEAIVAAVILMGLSSAAWSWRQAIRHHQSPAVETERWEHVRKLFPEPQPLEMPSETGAETLQSVVHANPFSRLRRHLTKEASETAGSSTPTEPVPPQFVFKGRMVMGTKERGILEDRQQKKTYFVQTGQEVAGFSVVAIAEDQIVLSNRKTNEELRIPLTSKTESNKTESKKSSAP